MSRGEMAGQTAWSDGQDCPCATEPDPVTQLLRMLTLLANCGLSAGAPPVLQTPQQS